ncbi:hypothetical protein Pmar_PMAR029267 [Perkinsus marinus ATCC 50983]|uniref:Uncharacterized protein n=1 Tax=Perkinsus marinus (strain ATCC 50983 / TXsc) TaxID=423536 RepID=C5KMP3_PERM5|nr:hypothetical protein Pmar_PMAR029267 [Perkinsus marinus ATCC 50983]EER14201.1 hypothetical protein Pmar_PMAR029267 [Perkinsus marinus ATCC 50983]|eukprot:XP_002782406.1 hypothetical protein Pmar_PMAR029267 [Perkinsus marinus ATCC 50983]
MTSEDAITCFKALSSLPTDEGGQEPHIQLLRMVYPFINPYNRDRSLDTVVTEVGDIVQTLAHNQTNTMSTKYLGKDNNILLQKLIYRLLDTNNNKYTSYIEL